MISPNQLVETFTQVTGIKARYELGFHVKLRMTGSGAIVPAAIVGFRVWFRMRQHGRCGLL
jgi:hypothetical protein